MDSKEPLVFGRAFAVKTLPLIEPFAIYAYDYSNLVKVYYEEAAVPSKQGCSFATIAM